jgi:hypothetical protein
MDHDDDIDTTHPWLVIPYFNGDEGRKSQRPLSKVTPPVTSWLCPSIHVQGVNYSTPPGTYLPDEPLQITIDVDNRGVPNAQVKLQVYWSDPATGFASPQLILSATQPVAGRAVTGPTRFPPLTWTPEHSKIPPHFCLLVRASCTPPEPDPGPLAPSPMGNRHWAQYNLQSAMLNVAGSKDFVFWAGNPALEAGAYAVTAQPLSEQALQQVARLMRAEPVVVRQQQLALHRATDPTLRRTRDTRVVLELARGERQALVLSAHDLRLEPQQFTAVEVVQTRVGHEREAEATGSLGVVLFGHVDETCGRQRR